jgi:hypothetical protein
MAKLKWFYAWKGGLRAASSYIMHPRDQMSTFGEKINFS